MVKERLLCMGLVILVGAAGSGSADTLAVTHAAALGGTTWGMEVFHDNNLPPVYVEDLTPFLEKTYRATFLIQVGTVSMGDPKNFRQSLLRGIGPNPNPGVGICPTDPNAMQAVLQLWLYQTGGQGQISNLQLSGKNNQCVDWYTLRIPIGNQQPYRVCVEYQTGSSSTGFVALALTSPTSACPASGDPAWVSVSFSNNLTSIDLVRLGTPAQNGFGAGETVTLYFDEFSATGADAQGNPMSFADGFEWSDTSGWGPPSPSCITFLDPDQGVIGAR